MLPRQGSGNPGRASTAGADAKAADAFSPPRRGYKVAHPGEPHARFAPSFSAALAIFLCAVCPPALASSRPLSRPRLG
ncbi:hypothetical protein [Lysobacter gummosus]|uniref:hypothetical protein n=1 Tax=Lysobacter gummosus TaxID=262324 RepID=UPI003631FCD9